MPEAGFLQKISDSLFFGANYNNKNIFCIEVTLLGLPMHFVYIIVSVPHPDHYYVGLTGSQAAAQDKHPQPPVAAF